jgi:hypothetical protein
MAETRSNPRREFLRHTVDVPIEVERLGEHNPQAGQGINVGHGGLAFVSASCPAVGELLNIRIPTVKPAFEGRARVAWCRPESAEYLIGVQFLDSAAAFRSRMVQQVCSIERYRRQIQQQEGRSLTPQEAAAEWVARYAGRFPDADATRADDTDDNPR